MHMSAQFQDKEFEKTLSNFKKSTLNTASELSRNASKRSEGLGSPSGFRSGASVFEQNAQSAASQVKGQLQAAQSQSEVHPSGGDPLRELGFGVRRRPLDVSSSLKNFTDDLATEVRRAQLNLGRSAAVDLRSTLAQNAMDLAGKFNSTARAARVGRELLNEARKLRLESELGVSSAPQAPWTQRVQQYEVRDRTLEENLKSADIALTLGAPLPAHARQSVQLAHEFRNESRSEFGSGALEEGESLQTVAFGLLDIALSVTPGVSVGKDAYELMTGKNLVTGESLSGFERGLAVVGVLSLGSSDTVLGIGKGLVRVGAQLGEALGPFVRNGAEIIWSSPRKTEHFQFDKFAILNSAGDIILSPLWG
jgi:hypothetical protein